MDHLLDEQHMRRCLDLAAQGLGYVQPNPLVGCVIAKGDTVLAEGYHKQFGAAHAEIEALSALPDANDLSEFTLYVNLEPCCHTGKTPPCTESILRSGIKRVVIGNIDVNPLVAGKGIETLREHNIQVESGCLSEECSNLNRRFETFHREKRPYIILKWAESADGFIARTDGSSKWISSEESRKLVHQWRHDESAILVGTNTVRIDNPELTVRHVSGVNPIRLVIDKRGTLPNSLKVFDGSVRTLVYGESPCEEREGTQFFQCNFDEELVPQILRVCVEQEIQSVFVEGGAYTLQSFIDLGLWDEARVFIGASSFGDGVKAPALGRTSHQREKIGEDELLWMCR